MKRIADPDRQVAYLAYLNRENEFQHHGYSEEMKQYTLMQAGDPAAVEESQRMMRKMLPVGLSTDPLRNAQYLFVANITIATRFAIEGGLDAETAYNISDMYIRKLDPCRDPEEVMDLHREMFSYFTARMAETDRKKTYIRPIAECVEYIEAHLHLPLRIEELAEHVRLSTSYLSVLFRRETGMAFSDYVLARRIETAQNMMLYSDYSSTEISEILAFSSQSYFIRCFRKRTGMTPKEYRQKHYARGIRAAGAAGAAEAGWR
ncbi:MAG: AraC family transcriptional regulator [Clostridiales bacterium]|nr:AraC family transcriptional regulator [Clostridiales bacterium]